MEVKHDGGGGDGRKGRRRRRWRKTSLCRGYPVLNFWVQMDQFGFFNGLVI